MRWLVKGFIFFFPVPALTTAWCAAARLWGCCLFLFFYSSPCGNEQTWHLPPSHSNPANQICFVKNNYTVIFNAAQIKRSLKSDGDFQSDVKHDLNMHLTPRQDSKTIKQEAGDDSPRGRDNIKHITLEPVHHVLILCYTILFVCCKNVQFCFLWRPCTTRDKLIHTYGSIFPLERSHTIRGCSENVLKKTTGILQRCTGLLPQGVDVFTSFCRGIFVPAALAGLESLLLQAAIVSQVVVVWYAQQQMGKNCCLAAPDT